MGAYQNNGKQGSSKSRSRGSVRNDDRLAAFANGSGNGSAEWDTADSTLVAATICAITAMGGAITFGLSRDQGAHSLTLMLDGHRKTMWYNGDAVLNDELQTVIDTLSAMD